MIKTVSGSQNINLLKDQPALAETVLVEGAHQVMTHQHPHAQLIHCTVGVLIVELEGQAYLVTTKTALWIPPETKHAVFANDSAHYCSVFVSKEMASRISDHVQTIAMKPLLKQLALTAAEFTDMIEKDSSESRVLDVLIDQLQEIRACELVLPLPVDKRMTLALRSLIANPSLEIDAEKIAEQANMSKRTMERIFKKETGFSFKRWQQRLLIIKAIELLNNDISVQTIAMELGYQSSSSFIAMFKRILNKTPTQYTKS